MTIFFLKNSKHSKKIQYLISGSTIFLVTFVCFLMKQVLGYKIIALLLLMSVSFLAMVLDILPVLMAAVLSALIWDFFFIPPVYTFHIDNAEDLLLFFLYFIIALVHAVLTFKIREAEKKSRDKEEKENTIKLYNTLLNSLSHELRTPISAILGAIDTLKEMHSNLSISNQFELLNQIDIASIRLNNQVENLLNMSRLETGLLKLNLEWCDMNELIHLCIQKLPKFATTKKIIFAPNEKLPFLKLDFGIMEQIIYNLLHNALQYTPENAMIEIQIYMDGNDFIICIADNGAGIPENQLENIFEKFFRLPNSKAGGTGLGLSIVKGFVEAHHGKIVAQNNIPHGLNVEMKFMVEASYINILKNE